MCKLEWNKNQPDFAHLLIFGEATDDAEQFRTARYNVTDRATTDNDVVWFDVPAWETKDAHEQTPNLAHIVQEIVERAGWSAGNSMAFIIEGVGQRPATSYDET